MKTSSIKKKEIIATNIQIGLSWDLFDKNNVVDLDASCVLFDDFGCLFDAVFYNQLSILNGVVVHSGDNTTGEGQGFDEAISINLESLPINVKCIVIVINCYKGGTFTNVETASSQIINVTDGKILADISLGCAGNHTGYIFSMIYRNGDSWTLRQIGRCGQGENFAEMEEDMREEISFLIPKELQEEVRYDPNRNKTFNLSKGDCININAMGKLTMGLGWDTRCDLDSHVFTYDPNKKLDGHVSFQNLSIYHNAIKLSGDNTTGEGSGDDEKTYIDLNRIPKKIRAIVCAIKVFSNNKTFKDVKGAYVRIVDNSKRKAAAKYMLQEYGRFNSQIMCVIFKDQKNQWKLKAIGKGCNKNELENECKKILPKDLKISASTIKAMETKLKAIPPHIEKKVPNFVLYTIKCKAENVDSKDRNGFSDPFFKLKSKGMKKYKSSKIKKTLNPSWVEFSLLLPKNPKQEIKVEVLDWNRFSKNDYIGEFIFTIYDLMVEKKRNFDIENCKKGKKAGTFIFEKFEVKREFYPNEKYNKLKKELDNLKKIVKIT